jgi:hypothetical protein
MADARKVQYGVRKLGKKAWLEQQAKNKVSTREATVYGKRKGGRVPVPVAAPVREANDEPRNPFVQGKGRVSIVRLGEILEKEPNLLDLAIETEVSHPDGQRKGALELLAEIEGKRPGGPRESVTKLLAKLAR